MIAFRQLSKVKICIFLFDNCAINFVIVIRLQYVSLDMIEEVMRAGSRISILTRRPIVYSPRPVKPSVKSSTSVKLIILKAQSSLRQALQAHSSVKGKLGLSVRDGDLQLSSSSVYAG